LSGEAGRVFVRYGVGWPRLCENSELLKSDRIILRAAHGARCFEEYEVSSGTIAGETISPKLRERRFHTASALSGRSQRRRLSIGRARCQACSTKPNWSEVGGVRGNATYATKSITLREQAVDRLQHSDLVTAAAATSISKTHARFSSRNAAAKWVCYRQSVAQNANANQCRRN
jgi:hypothetical protein